MKNWNRVSDRVLPDTNKNIEMGNIRIRELNWRNIKKYENKKRKGKRSIKNNRSFS